MNSSAHIRFAACAIGSHQPRSPGHAFRHGERRGAEFVRCRRFSLTAFTPGYPDPATVEIPSMDDLEETAEVLGDGFITNSRGAEGPTGRTGAAQPEEALIAGNPRFLSPARCCTRHSAGNSSLRPFCLFLPSAANREDGKHSPLAARRLLTDFRQRGIFYRGRKMLPGLEC